MSKNTKLTNDEFIIRAKLAHSNKYDYSLVEYLGNKIKVKIICPIHGIFDQTPSSHINLGNGCKKCAIDARQEKYSMGSDKFVERAQIIHGNKYDYSQVIYKNVDTKVKIVCPKHGAWEQVPWSHLKGHGCPPCQYEANSIIFTKTLDQFILDAQDIHGNKYDYSKSKYIDDRTKLEIVCKEHGNFWQIPSVHLRGGGCGKCAQRISNKETEWLDCLCLTNNNIVRQAAIYINNRKINADGYDPTSNTVYEFYGDYWHGNPEVYDPESVNEISHKTFGQLYQETMDREAMILGAGLSLVKIWELEFDKLFNKKRRSSLNYNIR